MSDGYVLICLYFYFAVFDPLNIRMQVLTFRNIGLLIECLHLPLKVRDNVQWGDWPIVRQEAHYGIEHIGGAGGLTVRRCCCCCCCGSSRGREQCLGGVAYSQSWATALDVLAGLAHVQAASVDQMFKSILPPVAAGSLWAANTQNKPLSIDRSKHTRTQTYKYMIVNVWVMLPIPTHYSYGPWPTSLKYFSIAFSVTYGHFPNSDS